MNKLPPYITLILLSSWGLIPLPGSASRTARAEQYTGAGDSLKISPFGRYPSSRPSKIAWEGKEYNINNELHDMLTDLVNSSVALDRNLPARKKALVTLLPFSHDLKGSGFIAQLIHSYAHAEDRELREWLLVLVGRSGDERSLPFLDHVARTDDDDYLRATACIGLASWNVRYGVEQLVEFLGSTKRKNGDMGREIREEAGIALNMLNKRRQWGFPQEALFADLQKLGKAGRDQKWSLFVARWNQWFTENKHRFPEWKPPVEEKENAQQRAP